MAALLELVDVHKEFPLGEHLVKIVRGIDLSIREGEFVAIVGPSGSGKTTCLEMLGALSRPTSGAYFFDGLAVHEMNDDAMADLRARQMGFVFQTFNLMPRMSATRNAALPLVYAGVPRADRERKAAEMLRRVGLGHRLEHLPAQLSGGERQRVAIARALVNDPRVVLADEPSGNLDERTGAGILELFRDLHRDGHTFVVVTHSPEVAAGAQRVVRLRDGSIESDERA
jgi:putative ABC transport system ATP-binding protein